jgi:hypothetical protein
VTAPELKAETRDHFWYAPDGSVIMQAWITTVRPADGPEPERHHRLTDEQAEELRRGCKESFCRQGPSNGRHQKMRAFYAAQREKHKA